MAKKETAAAALTSPLMLQERDELYKLRALGLVGDGENQKIRLECLKFANMQTSNVDEVMKLAEKYFDWIVKP